MEFWQVNAGNLQNMLSAISRRRFSLVCAAFLVFSTLSLTSEIGFSVSAGAAALQNNGEVSRNAWYQNEATLSQAALTSGQFGQRFATHLEGSIMGQPVVVNGTLVVGTEQDRIYGLDPATGVVKWSRIIGTPIEQAAQQGCGDLPIAGITASPVADPKTGAVYFLAKTEANDLSSRMIFQLHKVNASTGSELPNFPITYGGAADNDANIVFDGTYMTQRTGLLLDQGIVYAGFASVCDFGDFHGWVVGVDGSTGQTTSRFVTETGVAVGGGVWQSGVGIASDGPGQLLLTTGNGPTPAPGTPGNQPPGTLGQSIVRLSVQSDRSLKATDFFTPVTGEQLNDVDGDLGSSGPVVLPSLFHTKAASEILANGSKGGYLYLVNGKNLGGNGTGKNGGDATVATLGPIGAMFGSPVAWTGGGGYLYASSGLKGFDQGVAGPTLTAYKWGVNANGDAALTIAGSAREQPGFGSSSPVITSSGTSIPSAVLWQIWRPMAGGNAELRAFNPIPVNGQLQPIWSAPVGPLSKFLNPAVNNGWIYVGSNDGTLFGFGLAAKAPLALTSSTIAPTPAMTSKISTVVLSASRNVTITSISSTSARFAVSKVALPRVLSAGTSLSLPVTFKPVTSGSTSGSLVVAIAGEVSQAFALNSYGVYPGSRLTLSTSLLAMGNGGLGGPAIKNVFKVTNVGSTSALITTASGLRAPFSLTSSLLGKVILPGQSLTAGVAMALGTTGQFSSALTVGTKTQTTVLNLVGSVGQPAIVTVSPSGISFGFAPVGQSVTRSITLTNTGNTPANWFVSRPYFLNSQASFTLVGA
ncbi:MAG: PQQ-binding-like beta-propeller repeat protein, partial [Actinomycetes bacterium]